MFVDEQLEAVEFKSAWRKERYIADSGTQTKELPTQEVASQAIKRKHREVQTEDEPDKELLFLDDESTDLVDFLHRVEPQMTKHLHQNLRSHAFDNFNVSWEDKVDKVSAIHTLNHTALRDELQITGLAWNATGSVIAAAYGRFDHEDWCTHRSALCTWNIDRRSMDPNKPDTVLDLSSCLMCIAAHPVNPSWIVGGTFNGEVMVWDLSRQDETLLASSGIGDDSHREPVSKVQWVLDPDSKAKKKYNVVSVSGDGKILLWRVHTHKHIMKLIDGFILLTESLPHAMRMRAQRGDQEMGVTCLSYSPMDNTTFLIGSESGGIFRCSTESRGTHAGSSVVSSVTLQSPVTFTFNPHTGPVYSVECSPFHRNLFLTCGIDTSARIYTMLQTEPVITLEPGTGYLYSTKWSPVRPLVFAVACENGSILLYDLKHNRGAPRVRLEGSPTKQPVYTMQFNHKQDDLLATGDGCGHITIFRLSDDFSKQSSKETDILEEIASVALE